MFAEQLGGVLRLCVLISEVVEHVELLKLSFLLLLLGWLRLLAFPTLLDLGHVESASWGPLIKVHILLVLP